MKPGRDDHLHSPPQVVVASLSSCLAVGAHSLGFFPPTTITNSVLQHHALHLY